MAIAICHACGYPTVGSDLCFYCRPVAAEMQRTVTVPFPAAGSSVSATFTPRFTPW